jgi:hypothetical protein
MGNSLKIIQKVAGILLLSAAFLCVQSLDNQAYGQSNRKGKKNSFSVVGKSHAYIRHGVTIHVGGGISANLKQSISAVPMAGIGYVASQYYGTGNRFMQQSVTYQFGMGMDNGGYQTHNAVGTFHCSYIGAADLNPFVYGAALHFAYMAKNDISPAYSNFYVRPEIGIAFPAQYSDRTKGIQRVTAMITYGFNIKTFYNFNSKMEEYQRLAGTEEGQTANLDDIKRPWTAMNHHVITVRLNFNLGNIREYRR